MARCEPGDTTRSDRSAMARRPTAARPWRLPDSPSVVAIAGGRDMSYATPLGWHGVGMGAQHRRGDRRRHDDDPHDTGKVNTLTSVVAIAGGRDHGLALLADGRYGRGATTRTVSSATERWSTSGRPVQVAGPDERRRPRRRSAPLARAPFRWNGRLLGTEQPRQLGDGTLTQRRNAATIPGLTGVVSIGAGRDHGSRRPRRRHGSLVGTQRLRPTRRRDHRPIAAPRPRARICRASWRSMAAPSTRSRSSSDGPPDPDPPTAPGQPSGSSTHTGDHRAHVGRGRRRREHHADVPRLPRRGVAGGLDQQLFGDGSFTDTGLQPGSVHMYTVTALDGAYNESAPSAVSDPITVLSDPTADLHRRFLERDARELDDGHAIHDRSAQRRRRTAERAGGRDRSARDVGEDPRRRTTRTSASAGASTSQRGRVRSRSCACGPAASGPVGRVLVNDSGVLSVRSDVSGTTRASGVALGSGWHALEVCTTVGTAGVWDLYRDGVRIVNGWVANTGTAHRQDRARKPERRDLDRQRRRCQGGPGSRVGIRARLARRAEISRGQLPAGPQVPRGRERRVIRPERDGERLIAPTDRTGNDRRWTRSRIPASRERPAWPRGVGSIEELDHDLPVSVITRHSIRTHLCVLTGTEVATTGWFR